MSHREEEPQQQVSAMSRSNGHPATHARSGILIVVLLVLLLAALIMMRDGILQRAEWVVLYVGVALVTGIVFWLVTPVGTATLTIPQYGIRLSGGAAVGAAFMLLAHWLTPGPDLRAFELPPEIRRAHTMLPIDQSPRMDVDILRKQLLIVEFREGQSEGEVTIEYYLELEPVQKCFRVGRVGDLRSCKPRETG